MPTCEGWNKRRRCRCTNRGRYNHKGKQYCGMHLPDKEISYTTHLPHQDNGVVDLTQENLGECPICYETMEGYNSVMAPCKHRFHNKCIERWYISSGGSCPMCRSIIPHTLSGNTYNIFHLKQNIQSSMQQLEIIQTSLMQT